MHPGARSIFVLVALSRSTKAAPPTSKDWKTVPSCLRSHGPAGLTRPRHDGDAANCCAPGRGDSGPSYPLFKDVHQTGKPRRSLASLCRSGGRSTIRSHAFATASLGVLQRWFLPSSRLFSPRNQAAMITFPRSAPLATLLQRVREQYREIPGLKLTKPQATRLFGVAPSVCAAMLRAL